LRVRLKGSLRNIWRFSTIQDPARKCHHVSLSTETRTAIVKIAKSVNINTNRRKRTQIPFPGRQLSCCAGPAITDQMANLSRQIKELHFLPDVSTRCALPDSAISSAYRQPCLWVVVEFSRHIDLQMHFVIMFRFDSRKSVCSGQGAAVSLCTEGTG